MGRKDDRTDTAGGILPLSRVCSLSTFQHQQLRLHKRGCLYHFSCRFSFAAGLRRSGATLGTAAGSSSLLLMALMQSEAYQRLIFDHVVLPWPGVHGPFALDRLGVADYQPLQPGEARRQIAAILTAEKWLSPPPKPEHLRLANDYIRRRSAASGQAFYLQPCQDFNAEARTGSEWHHEWSHALVEFHEYLFADMEHGRCDIFCLVYE